MTMRHIVNAAGLALALLAGHGTLAAPPADPAERRVQQARDLARQAQAALQQARQERDALQAASAATQAEKQALADRLAAAESRARSTQARDHEALATAQAELARLREELAAERQAREQQQARADEALAAARQELAGQRQVAASVTALLERSTTALARAEQANRELHTLGLQAVDAYTRRTPEAMRAHDEPFLGLGKVALQDEADRLRQALDAQRVVR